MSSFFDLDIGCEDSLGGEGNSGTDLQGASLSEPAQSQDPTETSESSNDEQVPSSSKPTAIDAKVPSDVPKITADELSQPPDPPQASDAAYSWWGYLGLGGSSPSQAQTQQSPSEEPKKETLTSDRLVSSSSPSPSTTPTPGSPPLLSTDSKLYKAKADITVSE